VWFVGWRKANNAEPKLVSGPDDSRSSRRHALSRRDPATCCFPNSPEELAGALATEETRRPDYSGDETAGACLAKLLRNCAPWVMRAAPRISRATTRRRTTRKRPDGADYLFQTAHKAVAGDQHGSENLQRTVSRRCEVVNRFAPRRGLPPGLPGTRSSRQVKPGRELLEIARPTAESARAGARELIESRREHRLYIRRSFLRLVCSTLPRSGQEAGPRFRGGHRQLQSGSSTTTSPTPGGDSTIKRPPRARRSRPLLEDREFAAPPADRHLDFTALMNPGTDHVSN